jgi:hypothetical protein
MNIFYFILKFHLKIFFKLNLGKFIQDFTYISTSTIKLEAEIILQGSSLELCSLACVGADGFNCNSFDYCPKSETCLLNSNQNGPQQSSSRSAFLPKADTDECAHYKRSILI